MGLGQSVEGLTRTKGCKDKGPPLQRTPKEGGVPGLPAHGQSRRTGEAFQEPGKGEWETHVQRLGFGRGGGPGCERGRGHRNQQAVPRGVKEQRDRGRARAGQLAGRSLHPAPLTKTFLNLLNKLSADVNGVSLRRPRISPSLVLSQTRAHSLLCPVDGPGLVTADALTASSCLEPGPQLVLLIRSVSQSHVEIHASSMRRLVRARALDPR